jgi:hypothetical protein
LKADDLKPEIVIIAVVFIVLVLASFGFISLPFISQSNTIRVVVIGDDSTLFNILSNSTFTTNHIYAFQLSPDGAEYALKNFNVVILSGVQYCDMPLRQALASWVVNGGRLIVVGDACSLVQGDSRAIGWSIGINGLGGVMPVSYGGWNGTDITYGNVQLGNANLQIQDFQSPVFGGGVVPGTKNFAFSGNVTLVKAGSKSNILAFVNSNGVQYYGIVESQGMFQLGKVIYFSFDPVYSQILLYNTILYISGHSG